MTPTSCQQSSSGRTSGLQRTTGHTSQQADDRPHRTTGATTPEPNWWKSGDYRTSGRPRATGRPVPVCAQCSGPRPMYPLSHLPLRGPRLYILLHLLLARVSIGLAHIRDRALLIHIGSTPREILRPLFGEDPFGFKTSLRRRPQDLLTEKTGDLCIVLSCPWIV